MDYTLHKILQARILEWVVFPFSGDLPNPGIESRSPAFQADALTSEPEVKETWVQSLGQKDLLEKETATHSSILAWRILRTV